MVPISYKQFWGLNGTNPVKYLAQYLKHTKLLTSGSNLACHKSQFSQFLKHLTLGTKGLLLAPLPSMASITLKTSGFPLTNLCFHPKCWWLFLLLPHHCNCVLWFCSWLFFFLYQSLPAWRWEDVSWILEQDYCKSITTLIIFSYKLVFIGT